MKFTFNNILDKQDNQLTTFAFNDQIKDGYDFIVSKIKIESAKDSKDKRKKFFYFIVETEFCDSLPQNDTSYDIRWKHKEELSTVLKGLKKSNKTTIVIQKTKIRSIETNEIISLDKEEFYI